MPFCAHCGAADAANYCAVCGKPQGSNPPRKDVNYDEVDTALKAADTEHVLFEGTTWPMCCLSPLCCKSHKWKITNKKIDWDYGCCQTDNVMIDMRRVKDLDFKAPIWGRIAGRGVIVVHTDGDHPEVRIAKRHARALYHAMRDEWTRREVGVAA